MESVKPPPVERTRTLLGATGRSGERPGEKSVGLEFGVAGFWWIGWGFRWVGLGGLLGFRWIDQVGYIGRLAGWLA